MMVVTSHEGDSVNDDLKVKERYLLVLWWKSWTGDTSSHIKPIEIQVIVWTIPGDSKLVPMIILEPCYSLIGVLKLDWVLIPKCDVFLVHCQDCWTITETQSQQVQHYNDHIGLSCQELLNASESVTETPIPLHPITSAWTVQEGQCVTSQESVTLTTNPTASNYLSVNCTGNRKDNVSHCRGQSPWPPVPLHPVTSVWTVQDNVSHCRDQSMRPQIPLHPITSVWTVQKGQCVTSQESVTVTTNPTASNYLSVNCTGQCIDSRWNMKESSNSWWEEVVRQNVTDQTAGEDLWDRKGGLIVQ